MSFMRDHIHEIEVVVEGVAVHRHGLVFIGPPGGVTVRHRARPVEYHVNGDPAAMPPPTPDWDYYDPEEWDWEEDRLPHD